MFSPFVAAFRHLNRKKMISEMESHLPIFQRYKMIAAEDLRASLKKAKEEDYDVVKSLYEDEFKPLKSSLEIIKKECLEIEKEEQKANEEKDKNEAALILSQQKLSLLESNANILKEECSLMIDEIDISQKNYIIGIVAGTETMDFAFGSGTAMHNILAGITNLQAIEITAKIRNKMSEAFVYRPMTNVAEDEKRLMSAIIFFYAMGFLEDDIFKKIWFAFVWGGGIYGKVAIESQDKYALLARDCVEYLLHELPLSDYYHMMDTAKSVALSYYQEAPQEIQQHVAPLLET
jgi:hypothetical protein